MIGLAACSLATPKELAAQSTSRALVVVAEERVADCVKRIGGQHVDVKLLFRPEAGAPPSDYEAHNARVRGLLEFRLLVLRAGTCCPNEGLWRERMTAANPRGKVHLMALSRRSAVDDCVSQMQQSTDVHQALVSIDPDLRETLDANLKFEIHRLQSLRLHPPQLAWRE